jgi:hypothetical protein
VGYSLRVSKKQGQQPLPVIHLFRAAFILTIIAPLIFTFDTAKARPSAPELCNCWRQHGKCSCGRRFAAGAQRGPTRRHHRPRSRRRLRRRFHPARQVGQHLHHHPKFARGRTARGRSRRAGAERAISKVTSRTCRRPCCYCRPRKPPLPLRRT